jgi:subtilase family serine protease
MLWSSGRIGLNWLHGIRGTVGSHRGVPDISMSAACTGAVNVYQSFGGQPPGWYALGGTSEATPLFAGIVALADQVAGHPLGLINRPCTSWRRSTPPAS